MFKKILFFEKMYIPENAMFSEHLKNMAFFIHAMRIVKYIYLLFFINKDKKVYLSDLSQNILSQIMMIIIKDLFRHLSPLKQGSPACTIAQWRPPLRNLLQAQPLPSLALKNMSF